MAMRSERSGCDGFPGASSHAVVPLEVGALGQGSDGTCMGGRHFFCGEQGTYHPS